jgi:type IV secretion system protein VirD4
MQTNTRILGKDIYVENDGYKTQLNGNDLIVGGSGTGKTRGIVRPGIYYSQESLIITDTKGNLKEDFQEHLEKQGYEVCDIDFTNTIHNKIGYNPLDFIHYDPETDRYNEQDISTVSLCICPVENRDDIFWDTAARIYIEAIIGYVLEGLPKEEHTMASVARLADMMGTETFRKLFQELYEVNPNSYAVRRYREMMVTSKAERTDASIKCIVLEKLNPITFDGLLQMYENPVRIDFNTIGTKKKAVFLEVSDTDRSMDRLVSLFYLQALHTLCRYADTQTKEHRLPVPVRFILDDFASGTPVPHMDNILSVCRSRNISCSIIIQSISQLCSRYGEFCSSTIINNCDHLVYLGSQDSMTASLIADKANKTVSTILSLPLNKSIVFERGKEPVITDKYDGSLVDAELERERCAGLVQKEGEPLYENNSL